MPMTPAQVAAAPRHPQLMDPVADPDEFIRASVYWYPSLFGDRTAVLQNLLLVIGNGYEWNGCGQVRSRYAHIDPEYLTLAEQWARTSAARLPELEAMHEREVHREEEVRASFRERARTLGPVVVSQGWTAAGDPSSLMGSRPAAAAPEWEAVLAEAGQVFGKAQALQDAAAARLRNRNGWDRDPARRAAQVLAPLAGHAWAVGDLTDGELAMAEARLTSWAGPGLLDHGQLREQRARLGAHRARRATAGNRPVGAVLNLLAAQGLESACQLTGPAPFTGWHEQEWALEFVRGRFAGNTGPAQAT